MLLDAAWIDWHWFGPTEPGEEQHQAAHRIQMAERVERQASVKAGGIIAEARGRPGVREFMESECDQQCDDPCDEFYR